MTVSVDLEFVRDFWDCEISQGNVIELVPDFLGQSGDESADAEQLAFVGTAGL